MSDEKRFSPTYLARLTSSEWKRLCDDIKARAGGRCQSCGTRTSHLQVHHKHYRTLGRETSDDLMAVCSKCHKDLDRNRDAYEAQVREAEAEHRKANRRRQQCRCPYEPCSGRGELRPKPAFDTQYEYQCRTCNRTWHEYNGDLYLWIDGREVVRPRQDDE